MPHWPSTAGTTPPANCGDTMDNKKPPSIYDYWQALNIIEEAVKNEKEQVVLPAMAELWQTLNFMEEWVKSQKERIFAHLSKYFKDIELLLEVLDKGMD